MQLASRADKLLLDAGPVRRFLEVGTTLLALKSYLGDRALIVPQVRTELEVVQNWTGHAALKPIPNATPPWPSEVEVPGWQSPVSRKRSTSARQRPSLLPASSEYHFLEWTIETHGGSDESAEFCR